MKYFIIFFCCIILFNCNVKNKYIKEEILPKKETLEYHNFSNILYEYNSFKRIIFEFTYNDEDYKLMFHGKDNFIGFRISKNNKVDKNIPPYYLDF